MDLTYFSSKTEKRPSHVHGRGLFAKRPIARGDVVVVKGGYEMTSAQRNGLERALEDSEIQIGDDLFICPATQQELEGGMMHLNHSCDPNLGLQGQIVFVALRDIEKDEELTFDYAMTDDEEYEMSCNCGSSSCRGVVTGRDWMQRELVRRNIGATFRGSYSEKSMYDDARVVASTWLPGRGGFYELCGRYHYPGPAGHPAGDA